MSSYTNNLREDAFSASDNIFYQHSAERALYIIWDKHLYCLMPSQHSLATGSTAVAAAYTARLRIRDT